MSLPSRTPLVAVDPTILSYYKDKGGSQIPLTNLNGGQMTPDAAAALLELSEACLAKGGSLLITDCFRSVEFQAKTRKKYENWLAAGKPSASDPAYDSKTMKRAYVSRPGRSFHNSGRAVDIAHMLAAPEDVPKDQKLDWLWEVAKPIGWSPIIKDAREGQSEAWHFDFRGPWQSTFDRLGYAQGAMCAVLDLGLGEGIYERAWERWVQAQIHRCGNDIGDVDGYWGKLTKGGAEALGVDLAAPREEISQGLMAAQSA
jgi:hypothetical protein